MSYEPEPELAENYRSRAAQIGWPALADIATHAGDPLTAEWMRKQSPVPSIETEDGSVVPDTSETDPKQAAEKRSAAVTPPDDAPKGRTATSGKSLTA